MILHLLGEDAQKRSGTHQLVAMVALALFFLPVTFYILTVDVVKSVPPTQFSIIAVAPILGGLALSAAAGFKDRDDLIQVDQKFILATVLFIIFLAGMLVSDSMHTDPNDWVFSMEGGSRAFFFWSAALSFFFGIALFIVGLVDLVFTLASLGRKSKPNEHGCTIC